MTQFAKIFALLAFFASITHSVVNFPYPQGKSYGNGTINVTSANASANLKGRFTDFYNRFYEAGTGNNSNLARIKHDDANNTVSEGIGYGMIMMVYFSDNTRSYQSEFDKLWAYYNKWLDKNGLMHWKITGFTSINQQNAATDAEFDVAIALAMAYYQFGDEKYLNDAKSLIAKIRQHEISPNNLHKPGDEWDSERNPSYVSPAAFEIFKEVESGQASKWQSVIDANYTLLVNNQNLSSAGLFSDWCRDNGSLSGRGTTYSYDAARTPWRMAWANAWYGHATAKTLLTNTYTKFLNNKNANDIGGSISLTGTTGNDKNSTFLGPFTTALSYSSANQAKMNSFWDVLIIKSNESYYNAGLQVLTGLLASGNMPNLKALSENTPIAIPKTASSQIKVQAISNSIVLENLPRNANVEVYNLHGKQIYSANSVNSQILQIPVQTKGLYIVKTGSEVVRVPVR
jgi:endo-1,4-beta-D-glucanase Y